MGFMHHVARHRKDSSRPRSAGRVALHAALLRSVYHGARHGQRALGGRCAEVGDSAERAVHPQPDSDCARAARPHRALLPAVGAGLGGRAADPEGGSSRDFEAGGKSLALDAQLTQRTESGAGPRERRRQQRAAWNFRQWVLGTSGDAVVARRESAGILAISPCPISCVYWTNLWTFPRVFAATCA